MLLPYPANVRIVALALFSFLGPASSGVVRGETPQQPQEKYLYFPLVVNGQSGDIIFRTEFMVASPGDDATVRLDAYTRSGMPWLLEFPQNSLFMFQASLARGEIFSDTGNPAHPLEAGYVVAAVRPAGDHPGSQSDEGSLTSDSVGPGGTVVLSRLDAGSQALLTQVGVPAPRLLSEFSLKLDSRGSQDTGLAMVNPWGSSSNAHLRMTVWDKSFEEMVASTELSMPLGSALSRFIWEFFDDGSDAALVAHLQEMEGVVTVASDQPLAALTLRQTDDPAIPFPQEVPVLTVFPVIAGRGDRGEATPVPEADRLSLHLEGKHYDVFHAPGDTVDLSRQDAFFEWLEGQMGFSLQGRLQMFKYRDPQHMKRMIGLEKTGFAPGYSLNIHSVKTFDSHETVHVFTDARLGPAIPLLTEGIAVAHSIDDPLAGDPQPVWGEAHIHEVARQLVEQDQVPPLDSMLDAFAWVQFANSYPSYPLAGSFVRFLIDEHGVDKLLQFFRQSRVLDSPQQSKAKFADIFGAALADEWTRWQAFAASYPGSG